MLSVAGPQVRLAVPTLPLAPSVPGAVGGVESGVPVVTRNHDAIMRGLQQFRGRKYDYTPRNEIEEQYAYYPTETVERSEGRLAPASIISSA